MSFRLPSLVILALIEAEIAGRGRICPPLSRARDSQTLSSARVKAARAFRTLSQEALKTAVSRFIARLREGNAIPATLLR